MTKASHSATFCDLDETIYPGSTIKDVNSWFFKQQYLPASTFLKVLGWLMQRKLGLLDHDQAFADGVKLLAGWDEGLIKDRARQAYNEVVRSKILPGMRQLLKAWQQDGPVIIATESLDVIAQPLVDDLGLDGLIATRLEIAHGRVTGELASAVLFGEAKNQAVRHYAAANGIDLKSSRGVGSRPEDKLLLELVGHPVVINPSPRARRLARLRHWEVIHVT